MLAPHPPHQMACSLNNSSISNSIDIVAILIPAEKTKSDILIETFMSRPKNDMFYYLISFFIEMKLKLKVAKFFIALTLGFLKVACYCYPTWNAFRFSWKFYFRQVRILHISAKYISHICLGLPEPSLLLLYRPSSRIFPLRPLLLALWEMHFDFQRVLFLCWTLWKWGKFK